MADEPAAAGERGGELGQGTIGGNLDPTAARILAAVTVADASAVGRTEARQEWGVPRSQLGFTEHQQNWSVKPANEFNPALGRPVLADRAAAGMNGGGVK
jgi:hypothetical protein